MLDLSNHPKSLQLLMQTDGTVTDFIKLLAGEEITVKKVKEDIERQTLYRHIYLQGKSSKINWLYAESEIYLDSLNDDFVSDLLEHSIPIGALWAKYKMETFKQPISQQEDKVESESCEYPLDTKLLVRVYQVFNQQRLIMQITEKFPVKNYKEL